MDSSSRAPLVPLWLAAAAFLAAPTVAHAAPSTFAPSSKGNEIRFGAGPSFNVHDSYWAGSHWHGNDVEGKFVTEALFHFKGDAEGPALGPYAHLRTSGRHHLGGALGAMFAWDIQIPPGKRLALYVSPHANVGWGFNHHIAHGHGNGYHGDYTVHYFNTQVGVTGRLIIKQVFEIWLRPINADIFIGEDTDLVYLEVLAGIGFNF